MECAYYFGGRHMECAYYFDFCRLCLLHNKQMNEKVFYARIDGTRTQDRE